MDADIALLALPRLASPIPAAHRDLCCPGDAILDGEAELKPSNRSHASATEVEVALRSIRAGQ